MYCKECGNQLNDGIVCSNCGYKNIIEKGLSYETSNEEKISSYKSTTTVELKHNKKWAVISAIMFIISLVPLYQGYDKMTNYYSSETYTSLNKNAYVGGDAYNYIINAGYATAFFVLAVGAALLGVGFLIVYYISDKRVK